MARLSCTKFNRAAEEQRHTDEETWLQLRHVPLGPGFRAGRSPVEMAASNAIAATTVDAAATSNSKTEHATL
jgi:hypothetical protein